MTRMSIVRRISAEGSPEQHTRIGEWGTVKQWRFVGENWRERPLRDNGIEASEAAIFETMAV